LNWTLLATLAIQGVVIGSSYALLGAAFQIVFATTGIFHLAQSLVYSGAAYAAFCISGLLGLPLWLGVIVGLMSGVIIGLGIELGVYRPLRRRKAAMMGFFLASLGVATAGTMATQLVFGSYQRAVEGFPNVTWSLGVTTITSVQLSSIVAGWTCIGLLYLFLKKSKYGYAILGVSENPNMAQAVGIAPKRVFLLVFAIGSALASVSSLFFTFQGSASPTMGTTPTLLGFIAVFFGGISSLPGAALGGFILGMVSSLSGMFVNAKYANVIMFGVLFVLLIFRPQGLFGRKAR